jgi:hypothetical protein
MTIPDIQRNALVLLTRRTNKQTEVLMKKSAQKNIIMLTQLSLATSAIDLSLRKQTWRPCPCLTPVTHRAFRVIVIMAATRVSQSSEPGESLRAQSLKAVVMALGTVNTAAGMSSILPMCSSAGRGSQGDEEDMIVASSESTDRWRSHDQTYKDQGATIYLTESVPISHCPGPVSHCIWRQKGLKTHESSHWLSYQRSALAGAVRA